MKNIATITDREAMKGVQVEVTVIFKHTLRWQVGFWLLRGAVWLSAWLMGCGIKVGTNE